MINEIFQQTEQLKSRLNESQVNIIDQLLTRLSEVIGQKSLEELTSAKNVNTLKKIKSVIKIIYRILNTQQVEYDQVKEFLPELPYSKDYWDWEIGEELIISHQEGNITSTKEVNMSKTLGIEFSRDMKHYVFEYFIGYNAMADRNRSIVVDSQAWSTIFNSVNSKYISANGHDVYVTGKDSNDIEVIYHNDQKIEGQPVYHAFYLKLFQSNEDNTVIAIEARIGHEKTIMQNGKLWENKHDGLQGCSVSKHGQTVATSVNDFDSYGSTVIVNDKVWDSRFNGVGTPVVSDNGQTTAVFVIKNNKEQTICFNDQVWDKSFERLLKTPYLSYDGKVIVAVAWTKEEPTSKYHIVVNQDMWQTELDRVGDIVISPDNQQVAVDGYYINTPKGSQITVTKHFLVINDQIQKKAYADISEMQYSPDSQKLVYVGKNNRKADLMVNDQKLNGGFDDILKVTISSDSKYVAAAIKTNKDYQLIINKKVLNDVYEGIFKIEFSPDNKKIMILATRPDRQFYRIVKDISKIKPLD